MPSRHEPEAVPRVRPSERSCSRSFAARSSTCWPPATWSAPRTRSTDNSASWLALDRVARQARAHLQQRHGPVTQRGGVDRRPAVEDRRRLPERLAERLVVRVPPRVLDRRSLPNAELDVHALVQSELRVGAPQPGFLDSAPRALAGAVAEHVVVDPHHAGLELAGDPLAATAIRGPDRGAEPE